MTTTLTTKSDRTREAVRAAADSCFREYGFAGATTAEIARRAGVADGTVFLHYGNKLGLLTAVTAAFYGVLQAEAEEALATSDDASTRFRSLVDGWASRIDRDWDLIRVFAQHANSGDASDLSDTVNTLNRRYTRLYVGLINELKAAGSLPGGAPSSLVRDMIFGTLEHTARGQEATGRAIKTRDTASQMLDLLFGADQPRTAGNLDTIEAKLDQVLARLD